MGDTMQEALCEDIFAKISDEIEIASKYLAIFIDETELSLDDIADTLLALEGGGREEELRALLINSHRIKGSAASVGLNRAAKMAHLMEDLLQQLVDGGGLMSPELTDAMLKCTDGLRAYVQGLKQGSTDSDQFSQLARELIKVQNSENNHAGSLGAAAGDSPASDRAVSSPAGNSADSPPPSGKAEISAQLRRLAVETAPSGAAVVAGAVAFQPGLPLSSLKAQLLYEKLLNLGDLCYMQPAADRLEELECIEGIQFGLLTDKPLAQVQTQLEVAGVADVALEQLGANRTPADPTSGNPAPQSPLAADIPSAAASGNSPRKQKARESDGGDRPAETLRVDIDRLDQLMNLAGQLVINKARFVRIGEQLRNFNDGNKSLRALDSAVAAAAKMAADRPLPQGENSLRLEVEQLRDQARRMQNDLQIARRRQEDMAEAHDWLHDLADAIHQLGRVSDGIQKSVMDTRMVPIGPLFNRFKRVVRDIARSSGKDVRLEISGEKTELDKRMVDELGDPLIHMVRNSADHGIENPEDRAAAGKPAQGVIRLSAFQRGNSIVVQVCDDGRGMDIEEIAEKAVRKGLVSAADVAKMTPRQIAQLAWEPGLSTAVKVTEVSGRGMGMDIVKSKIEELNGAIDLDTSPGQGTTITIKLPLTLAILPSLMVDVDGDVLAMPIESVSEIVSIDRREVKTLHGKRAAQARGRVISLVRLNEVFAWNAAADNNPAADNECDAGVCSDNGKEMTVVVVADRGREIGLVVDRVIGEEDIVIKSMADNYRNVAGIAGASILGDGRVSLILDVVALVEMAVKNNNDT